MDPARYCHFIMHLHALDRQLCESVQITSSVA